MSLETFHVSWESKRTFEDAHYGSQTRTYQNARLVLCEPPGIKRIRWSGFKHSSKYERVFHLQTPYIYYFIPVLNDTYMNAGQTSWGSPLIFFGNKPLSDRSNLKLTDTGLPNVFYHNRVCLEEEHQYKMSALEMINTFWEKRSNRDIFEDQIITRFWLQLARMSQSDRNHVIKIFTYWQNHIKDADQAINIVENPDTTSPDNRTNKILSLLEDPKGFVRNTLCPEDSDDIPNANIIEGKLFEDINIETMNELNII